MENLFTLVGPGYWLGRIFPSLQKLNLCNVLAGFISITISSKHDWRKRIGFPIENYNVFHISTVYETVGPGEQLYIHMTLYKVTQR